jgi:Aminotransferase class-III
VPAATAGDTIVCPFNDADAVERAVERYGDELACILVEPVAANMGVVPPAPGFRASLRSIADRSGAMLLFDEVITGFRLWPRGRAGARRGSPVGLPLAPSAARGPPWTSLVASRKSNRRPKGLRRLQRS